MDLLMNYSLKEILIFTIALIGCTIGVLKGGSYLYEYISKIFNHASKKQIRKEKEDSERRELINSINNLTNRFDTLEENVKDLIQSDKDDIKFFITKEYLDFAKDKKCIDIYSLECIETRYAQYRKYGGNSFVEGFMKELRRLPKIELRETKKPV